MEKKIEVTEQLHGKRLDIAVNLLFPEFSRSFLKNRIEKGEILIDGKVCKAGAALKKGSILTVNFELPKEIEAQPQDVDFELVYEDDDLAVINKPQGLVVHPCTTAKDHTLVNGLLQKISNLSGINGQLRPGIVHRLDKNTSGLMLVAKNDFSHNKLSSLIKDHKIDRRYLALVLGVVWDNEGEIETYLARDKKNRKKYCVSTDGKKAISNYKVIKRYQTATLLEFSLVTGRTHQIRVHSAHLGHPVVGDEVYGKPDKKLSGQLLHSYFLSFEHPRTGKQMHFEAELPTYFNNYLAELEEYPTIEP